MENASDTDVLVNSAHLYGDTAGILDQAVVDGHQGGYDVLTSGYLSGFGEIVRGTPEEASTSETSTNSDLQIRYSGDAGDFVDGDDAITRDASDMHVAQQDIVSPELGQSQWESDSEGADAVGGDFYVQIENTKVAVYFDELDQAWKVDTTAFGVANDVSVKTVANAEAIEDRIDAATGKDVDLDVDLSGQDIFLNATESDIISLLGDESLGTVLEQVAHNFSFYTTVDGVNVAVEYDDGDWVMSTDEVLVRTDENTLDADGEIGVGSVGSTSLKWVMELRWVMPAPTPTPSATAMVLSSMNLAVTIDDDLGLTSRRLVTPLCLRVLTALMS